MFVNHVRQRVRPVLLYLHPADVGDVAKVQLLHQPQAVLEEVVRGPHIIMSVIPNMMNSAGISISFSHIKFDNL